MVGAAGCGQLAGAAPARAASLALGGPLAARGHLLGRLLREVDAGPLWVGSRPSGRSEDDVVAGPDGRLTQSDARDSDRSSWYSDFIIIGAVIYLTPAVTKRLPDITKHLQ